MPQKEYHRLTRAKSRSNFSVFAASRSSLWLGRDHLLCIDSNGYTESYKRFYYRDIQAITIVANKRRIIWNWILVIPTILCLAMLFSVLPSRNDGDWGIVIVYTICTFLFALPLLINNLLGPTCTCYLRTAVQIEELPSLSRVRRARKVLDRIRPFVIAVQGGLSPEEIPSGCGRRPCRQPASPPPRAAPRCHRQSGTTPMRHRSSLEPVAC